MNKYDLVILAKRVIDKQNPINQKKSYAPTMQELKQLIGNDWSSTSRNIEALKGCARTVTINRMVASGVVPKTFKFEVNCKQCGIVLLDYDPCQPVIACPWCFCDKKPKFTLQ